MDAEMNVAERGRQRQTDAHNTECAADVSEWVRIQVRCIFTILHILAFVTFELSVSIALAGEQSRAVRLKRRGIEE